MWLTSLPEHLRFSEDNLEKQISMFETSSNTGAWCYCFMHTLHPCYVLDLTEVSAFTVFRSWAGLTAVLSCACALWYSAISISSLTCRRRGGWKLSLSAGSGISLIRYSSRRGTAPRTRSCVRHLHLFPPHPLLTPRSFFFFFGGFAAVFLGGFAIAFWVAFAADVSSGVHDLGEFFPFGSARMTGQEHLAVGKGRHARHACTRAS